MKNGVLAFLLLGIVFGFSARAFAVGNGELWPDTDGVHINAHGGGVLYYEGTYYWYGEHKIGGEAGNKAHGAAVRVYSSRDLLNWHNEGAALSCVNEPFSDIADGSIIERPKVLYCAKTRQFVMRFHLELPHFTGRYQAARTGVAVSSTPTGPFRYLYGSRANAGLWPQNAEASQCTQEELEKAARFTAEDFGKLDLSDTAYRRKINMLALHFRSGQMTRDQTLFVDDDGKAYQISASEENSTLQIAELTDDYLLFTGRYWRMAEKDWTEAPAVMKRGEWYYLLGSGCTGWRPNAARIYRARRITGPWERLGNPCRGVNTANGLGPEKTWGGQSTFILKLPGEDRYVAMFDRWQPENAIDGRYFWLPIEFEKGCPVITWRDDWKADFITQNSKGDKIK